MTDKKRYSSLELYRRLFSEAKPYRWHIGGILFVSLLSTPLSLLVPLPLKIVVDSVLGSHPLPASLEALLPEKISRSADALLLFAAGLTIGIAFFIGLQRVATLWLRVYTGEKLTLAFRAKLFRHVQRLSISYHDRRGSADATYRIQYDAPAIQWICVDGLIPFVVAALTFAAMISVIGWLDLQLALVALAISPILYLGARTFTPRLRDRWWHATHLEGSAFSVVQEVLGALRIVKAFGQEEREQDRFIRHSRASVLARVRAAASEGTFDLLIGVTTAAGTAAVLFLGARHVQSGALTLGELLFVMTYLVQLFGPLALLSEMTGRTQRSLASAERAFALLDETPDVIERKDCVRISRARGAITFRNVSFAYDGDRPVLQGISFAVAPATRVGIMGMTGAGKSTLVSLLTRFYDPTRGQILLDGIDLRDYNLADLRNQFGIVLQEPILFSTSVAENIAYAAPSASEHEIIAAAKAARAHEFISRLPDGYRTLVGERGMQLSGGERQRIALARAFLKNAPILILDEPTSSIDIRTEKEIIEVMERLSVGRTVFIIAHRLSTLKHCDLLLGIDQGRLAFVRSDVSKAIAEASGFLEHRDYWTAREEKLA
ncbi:MAG TPA: ABC transporter ATP-binding protein [Candidatus Acidoferrales bacterium]|nr:ABC transporter ATP-binding protein [Candidatus Acidoferrales bacterium]